MSKNKTTQEWQLISEFPEDYDESVLITDGKSVVAGFNSEIIDGKAAFCYHDYPDSYNIYHFEPTHFMMLPKPPKTTRGIEYEN